MVDFFPVGSAKSGASAGTRGAPDGRCRAGPCPGPGNGRDPDDGDRQAGSDRCAHQTRSSSSIARWRLELFFDLVFVVVISEARAPPRRASPRVDVVKFVVQFMAVFWCGTPSPTHRAVRVDRHGKPGVHLPALVPVAGLAVFADDGLAPPMSGSRWPTCLPGPSTRSPGRGRPGTCRFSGHRRPVLSGHVVVTATILAVSPRTARPGGCCRARWPWISPRPLHHRAGRPCCPSWSTSKFPERFGLLT